MTTILVDGDVVAYKACEDRHTRGITNAEALMDIFPGYEKFRIATGEEEFSDEENELYLLKAFHKFKMIINDLKEECFADNVRVAVGGIGNYRKDIFPAYKANRHAPGINRNPFVPLIRLLAAENEIAIEAHGMEADDLLRIWAEECRAAGEHFIVCSIDKDLKMIEGQHYLMHKMTFFESTPEYAMRFYHEQLLMGDPVDNIPGVPRVGPEKAKAFLKDCVTEADFQAAVMQVYYSTVHQWRYALQLTGQLIYLKKSKEDWFDMSRWPVITLEDIVNKPKKSKKPMEEWTLQAALDAINPYSVTTRQRWESALLFLVELKTDLPNDVMDAIDVLTERDKVPSPEIEAYRCLVTYMKRNIVTTPDEVVDETFGAPTKIPTAFNKTMPSIPMLTAKPVIIETVSVPVFVPKVETPKVEIPKTVAVLPTAPIGLPAFNPSWIKKK
jgi:5'-3' exonuclease